MNLSAVSSLCAAAGVSASQQAGKKPPGGLEAHATKLPLPPAQRPSYPRLAPGHTLAYHERKGETGMIARALLALVTLFLLLQVSAQEPAPVRRLPDGRSQNLAILQSDYEKSKEDIAQLIALAHELEEDIEKNREFVLDVRSLRKVEKIEDLAGKIKSRMKRVQ